MAKNIPVRKNWMTSIEIILRKPIILLPFFIIAFLEGLALELIYFSTRKPLSYITAPIIRKFSGEAFLHYPFNLIKLPKLFYYSQILIYVFAGAFLTAISINILRNIKEKLPLRAKALIKNALNRYLSLVVYGIILISLIFLLGKADMFIFSKLVNIISKHFPRIVPKWFVLPSALFFFLTDLIMYTFLVLVVPIIVIEKKPLLKAITGSVALGFRNFFNIFALIFLPHLVYLPIPLLKAYLPNLVPKTFPEISVLILSVGIIIAAFIDCFVIVCATQFLLEGEK